MSVSVTFQWTNQIYNNISSTHHPEAKQTVVKMLSKRAKTEVEICCRELIGSYRSPLKRYNMIVNNYIKMNTLKT